MFYWTPRRASTRYSEGVGRNKTRNYGQLGRHICTNNPAVAVTTTLSSTSRVTCRCGATAPGYFRQKPVIAPTVNHCGVLRRTIIIELSVK